jgi:hypothetical protein
VREVRPPVQSAIRFALAIGAWGLNYDRAPLPRSRAVLARSVLGARLMRISQGVVDLPAEVFGIQVGEP